MTTNPHQPMPPSAAEIARAWEYLAAANNLLAQRFNYALVAHSMALAAYATCVSSEPIVSLTVAVGAILYCIVQFKITYPLSKKIDALRAAYLSHDIVYRVYQEEMKGKRTRGLQSVAVPAGLSCVWGILIIIAFIKIIPPII